MNTPDRKKHKLRDTLLPLLLCLCFIASSLLFLVQMILKSQEQNIEYLYNAANQKKISIVKQIEGDLQTLKGLAIVLGGMEDISTEVLVPLLRDINEENAFIQMGFVELSGEGWLVDLDGVVHQVNLGDKEFFKDAAEGECAISDILMDELTENKYVNYYGVNISNRSGETIGILCAVHSADVLRKIIDAPVLSGQGYSNIVDGSGTFILRSISDSREQIAPEDREQVAASVIKGGTASFTMPDQDGRKQAAVLLPLLEDRWYLLSTVPEDVLRARYIETAGGIMAIILVACSLFTLFFVRQRRMSFRTQKMLMELAYRDSLTGLRNYDGFKLDAGPILAREKLTDYVLWYGDLKKFKFINDMLGYEEGDKVLKLISAYLSRRESKDSIVCRISADNFAGIGRCEGQKSLMREIRSIQEYLKEQGVESLAFIELSVGFYRLCPGDEQVPVDVLVNYANMAHKIAKERPGSACALFDSQIRRRQIEDSVMEAEAEQAILDGEFKVYMQPKVNIQNNNCLSGAEALVRWHSPTKGLIPPGRFIPLFENSDRIVMLDRYMFQQTCSWYQNYLERGGRPLSIAVNVSKVGLLKKDFIEYYASVKARYQIPDGHLELEFTESVLLNDMDMFAEIVNRLKGCGFICSLDDFGSGYSSLNLLKDLPIDVLKLDIMFFHKSRNQGRERIVISNFIHMARELKIKTIAEGVETVDSVEFLKECGCDVVQGFAFFRPMPLEEFDQLIELQGTDPAVPEDV